MNSEKTIFALATALGGAIAIVRISGSKTHEILRNIFTGKISHSRLCHGKITDNESVLDDSMAVFFKAPHSYTGEDMAELHIHASVAVANSVCALLMKSGAQPAQAGEFTKRAFLNGKMKLSQAEAVTDLINASAKRSADSAILQLSGVLCEKINSIETALTNILSQVDATIDYPDEMQDEQHEITSELQNVQKSILDLLKSGMQAHKIRDGFTITIAGKPNVGKSSLLNALIMDDKAIVTNVAGTTRDIIEADATFCGLPVHLFDTAGLHNTSDTVERIGIERTRSAISSCDLVYVAIDSSDSISNEEIMLLNETKEKQRIIVLCKADLASGNAEIENSDILKNETLVRVSSKTGEGIETLKNITAQIICPAEETGILTNMRHINALERANRAICDALCATELDFVATDLQNALHNIGEITGNAVDDMVLDSIFSRFCVGK